MTRDCECPPMWNAGVLVPCDHELQRDALWQERYEDYWGDEA